MMKILVVDDDVDVLRSIGNAFTTLLKGYLVLTATTANQGLNFIKQEKPEVIIMDVRLGPLSGMDLLEDYPKHTGGYTPRVIVITAYDDERVRRRAKELSVEAFIMKPLRKNTLLAAALGAIKKQLLSELGSVELALKAFEGEQTGITQADEYLDLKKRSLGEEDKKEP